MERHTINRGLREQQQNEQYQSFGQYVEARSGLDALSQEQRGIGQLRFVTQIEGLFYFDGSTWKQGSAINIEPVFYEVADIDMPSEIASVAPRTLTDDINDSTDVIVAVQNVSGGTDKATIYRFQPQTTFTFAIEDLGPLDGQTTLSPYVMAIDGQQGYWVAVSGEYAYGYQSIGGNLYVGDGGGQPSLAIKAEAGAQAKHIRYDATPGSEGLNRAAYLPIRNQGQNLWLEISSLGSAFPSENGIDVLASHNYGSVSVGGSSDLIVQLVNNSDGFCSLVLASASGTEFTVETAVPIQVAPASTENMTVRYTPAGIGVANETLDLFFNSEVQAKYSISLSGQGTA